MIDINHDAKTRNRKFYVWITWLIISIFIIVCCVIVMIIKNQLADNLIILIEKTLSWFFAISMNYFEVNVGQKKQTWISREVYKRCFRR